MCCCKVKEVTLLLWYAILGYDVAKQHGGDNLAGEACLQQEAILGVAGEDLGVERCEAVIG
jgi:hypothetical protein